MQLFNKKTRFCIFRTFCLFCYLSSGSVAYANPFERHADNLQHPAIPKYGVKAGSFVGFPIPFKSPVLGTGLALGAGYLFKDDKSSHTSFIGLGGFKSDNGSLGYGLIANVAINENKWVLKSFLGTADLFYDIYGPGGTPVPLRQEGDLAKASLSYGFTHDFSIGGAVRYIDSQLSPGNGGSGLPGYVLNDTDLAIFSLGVIADWDTRDDTLYPTDGRHADLAITGSTVANQSDRIYGKAILKYDTYVPVGSQSLFASRATLCGASSETPFFDMCSLGGSDGFRGYSSTRFLGGQLASLQVAYRHRFTSRFGAVAFAGAGIVSDTRTGVADGDIQVAGGIGGRFRLSKKFPLDFSVDVSVNADSEQLVYIYVGQKF